MGDEDVIESCGKRFDALFTALREARNDVAHTGAYARHVAADAVVLCLVLEEALMSKRLTVGDFMVSKPVWLVKKKGFPLGHLVGVLSPFELM